MDPDIRLMLQVRDDVPGAFEGLVQRYQDRLVGILYHFVGSHEEAEDLSQDRPADLQGAQGVSSPGQVLDVAVHDRQQPGAERPAGQGAEPDGAHERAAADSRPSYPLPSDCVPRKHGIVPDAARSSSRRSPRGPRDPGLKTSGWPSCSTSSKT